MRNPRRTAGRWLAGVAAVGYLTTAGLHSTGLDSVTALARQGPADLAAAVPMLWIGFSLDLWCLAWSSGRRRGSRRVRPGS